MTGRVSVGKFGVAAGLAVTFVACRATPPEGVPTIPLPDGTAGIGFDDLRFSPALGKVLVPAGRSGYLDLVDPATRSVTAIDGFSKEIFWFGGSQDGLTSVDEDGTGVLFATDRTTHRVHVVDAVARRIVARADLASTPDYVRYVAATNELWVTEPDDDRIEVLTLSADHRRAPMRVAFIATPGGPESLVIDHVRRRAYTHRFRGSTLAIDLASRSIVEEWPNGCRSSRGIALDEARGFLFAACKEGRAVVLAATAGGQQLSRADAGRGVDNISYSSRLGHLYVPGADSGTLTVVAVSAAGELSVLGTKPSVDGGHCATFDDRANVYVCDPSNGQLLVISDPFPPTG